MLLTISDLPKNSSISGLASFQIIPRIIPQKIREKANLFKKVKEVFSDVELIDVEEKK